MEKIADFKNSKEIVSNITTMINSLNVIGGDESAAANATDFNKIKNLIFSKICYLHLLRQFSQKYSSSICTIFKKLNEIIIKKITITLNLNKNFLKFFKDINSAYQKFSNDLIGANSVLNDVSFKDQILSDNVNKMFQKTQENIANNFLNFSSVLQKKIIIKGPFEKVGEFYKRLSNINKEILNNIEKIENRREKLIKTFSSKYENIFDQFKKFYNDDDKLNNTIILKHDFYLIEMEMNSNFNSLYHSTLEFLNIFKNQINLIKSLVTDYMVLVKEIIQIYIDENVKIFSGSMNINFENIHKIYDSISKESSEFNLTLTQFLKDEASIKQFNDLLSMYQTDFLKFNIVKKDGIINNDENFKIEKYNTLEEFIDLFINLNPQSVTDSELSEHKIEIKYDPGVFKSWKNSWLIITKQNNAVLFDDEIIYEKYLNYVNIKKIKFKSKEEKKYPFRFEIIEERKGFFNSKITFYLDAVTREKFDEVCKWLAIETIVKKSEGDSEKAEENLEIKQEN